MIATSRWRRRALATLAAVGTTGAMTAMSFATPVGAMQAPHAVHQVHQAVTQAAGSYCLYQGEELTAGQAIEYGGIEAVMGSDGNFVMIDQAGSGHAVWANGATGHPGAYVIMQSDGNLVEYYQGHAVWSTGTSGHSGAYTCISLWAGMYVWYAGAFVLWHTPVWGFSSSLYAGQSLGQGNEIDDYYGIYSVYEYGGWVQLRTRSNNDLDWYAGSSCSGTATANMQSDGNFVIYCNGVATWSTHTGGHPASYGYYLHLQACSYYQSSTDGVNLDIFSNYGQLEWSSNSCGKS
jgi:hypothetical protein